MGLPESSLTITDVGAGLPISSLIMGHICEPAPTQIVDNILGILLKPVQPILTTI
jgi:hypothetical protein